MSPPQPELSGGPAPSFPTTASNLTRKQKAAIVVRLLLGEGATLSLAKLPEQLQADLTEHIGALRLVDRKTLHDVLQEFLTELESVGMAFSGGLEGALSLLDGSISPVAAGRLRRGVGSHSQNDPWERIAETKNSDLLSILFEESVEVCAVILSKLNVAKSAELLGLIPGPKARRIVYAISMTGGVTKDALERIGKSVVTQIDARPVSIFSEEPVERVSAILNSSFSTTRDDVLVGLEETDAEFASRVRKAIFTFADIPSRIDARDIPKIIRGLEQKDLATALTAAQANDDGLVVDYVLDNMPKRMADQLRTMIEDMRAVQEPIAETAMSVVIAEIQKLATSGEITIAIEEDAERNEI
ncbi:FliG C-terminal domain-containing protein [Pseudohalocynthiibacter aestuariivivens]|jgi:flagellar motor switch protein FliG|uniref:Flagellar motor switch protein FliG n=1 Tax=Pseudohalocynthiibacter aestuariivivens TaxID=1591409 RepID=A0ABV5JEE3_9RHOB|nr:MULTISPECIES: FliG C-terminal domain-containing protein [Pseudohalocynthiibacter]MBS9718585.1 flagellar motor switch protein FliG [Pseudohalocynthiibacter aestuariivivens]MCK0103597.1 flagellar motor switch protein FliG [Pseudohalocynthiibacter sp. F2068]